MSSDAPVSLLTGLEQLVWNVTQPGHLRTDIQVFMVFAHTQYVDSPNGVYPCSVFELVLIYL